VGLGASHLYWTGHWRFGYKSQNLGRRPSFEINDWIVAALLANDPNLKHIAVVGHSAGAQFANGYAAGNAIEETASARGVTMSYGVSAPGRYMWLTSERPGRVDQCSGFNKYPYGL